nr:2,3-bisphosphoglycerate-independent phosphoglycerate mutase-like [Tanacetum cinerariifolium]
VRAERAQGVAHGAGIQALDQEDTRLLDFGDEGDFFAVLHFNRQGQHDFVEVIFKLLLAGVQIKADAWGPFLTEDSRAFRRFKGQVANVDALQGKLRCFFFVGSGAVAGSNSGVQQLIELAGALQGKQIIATADVDRADPDLRHRGTPGFFGHFSAQLWLAVDFDLLEADALASQQRLGAGAVGAIIAGIDDDVGHFTSPEAGEFLLGAHIDDNGFIAVDQSSQFASAQAAAAFAKLRCDQQAQQDDESTRQQIVVRGKFNQPRVGFMTTTPKPLVLIILDGFGHSDSHHGNAVYAAKMPVFDRLYQTMPNGLISGSGMDVGLPDGQMGNSEVGHMNLGAGRVVYQDFTRVTKAIRDGEFFENPNICKAVDQAVSTGKAVHILGLLSDGGVHSHEDHLVAMVELAAKRGADKIYLHAFLDGRDTPPRSAHQYLATMEATYARLGKG